jgi:uncharacterized membrane protein YsdA (DUF1294 family)/cold shock CspA family protein
MKPGPVRMTGELTTWNDERGFGFVAPAVGGPDVFVHISAFDDGAPRPVQGDDIGYVLEFSPEGKPRASHAELTSRSEEAGDRSPGKQRKRVLTPSHHTGRLSYIAVAGFIAIFAVVWLFVIPLPLWVVVLYGGMSLVTFIAYALDKRAAATDGWRVAEGSLLALGLVGGWPGAIVAQQMFRHKTVKVSFQVVFWVTVVVNVVAFVVFAWVSSLELVL